MLRAPLVIRNLVKATTRRAGHGHAAPSAGNSHPKWLQALEEAPRAQTIASVVGAVIVTSGLIASIVMARGDIRHVSLLKNESQKSMNFFLFPHRFSFDRFFPFRYSTTYKI